jgi:hypothetical protein
LVVTPTIFVESGLILKPLPGIEYLGRLRA